MKYYPHYYAVCYSTDIKLFEAIQISNSEHKTASLHIGGFKAFFPLPPSRHSIVFSVSLYECLYVCHIFTTLIYGNRGYRKQNGRRRPAVWQLPIIPKYNLFWYSNVILSSNLSCSNSFYSKNITKWIDIDIWEESVDVIKKVRLVKLSSDSSSTYIFNCSS